MSSEAVKEPALAELKEELASTNERLGETAAQLGGVSEQLSRVEALLRASLKRAPKRHDPGAEPRPRTGKLTDEQRAAIRKRMTSANKRGKGRT